MLVVIIEVFRWMGYGSVVDVGGIINEEECCNLCYDCWIGPGKDSVYKLTP